MWRSRKSPTHLKRPFKRVGEDAPLALWKGVNPTGPRKSSQGGPMIVLYIDPGTSEFLFHIERYVICPVDLWTESSGGKLDVTCPVRRKLKSLTALQG